jgi:hypothetical protein
MPAEFGAPAKVSITEDNNKILIQLLSYDTSGKLTNIVSNTLRQNVATYLSNYRMMNDYISILSAEVIDLSVDVQIVLDSAQNSGQIIADVVDRISGYWRELKYSTMLGDNIRQQKHQWNIQTLRPEKLHLSTIQSSHNHLKFIKLDILIKISEFPLKISNQLHSLNRFILVGFGL